MGKPNTAVATRPEQQEQSDRQSVELTVSAGRGRSFSMMPTSYAEVREFADLLAFSDMVPKDYQKKPGNVMVAIMMGSEIGLPPLAAVQNIAVINGRPSLWGDGLLAVALAHHECEDVREHLERGKGDDEIMAVCTVLRRGREPVVCTFSVADAKKAGLWGKGGPWTQHPKRMLKMRARAFAIRDAFADALKGIGAADEEADTAANVVTATVVRRTGGNADLRALAGDVPEATAADKAAAQDYNPATGEVSPATDAPKVAARKMGEPPPRDIEVEKAQIAEMLKKLDVSTFREVMDAAAQSDTSGVDTDALRKEGVARVLAANWTPGDLADAISKARGG